MDASRAWSELIAALLQSGSRSTTAKEERIRAHVILCWLALLLVRIAETATGTTWNNIADELDVLTLGTFTGPAGTLPSDAELTARRNSAGSSVKAAEPGDALR
jgi:hypothetical protein